MRSFLRLQKKFECVLKTFKEFKKIGFIESGEDDKFDIEIALVKENLPKVFFLRYHSKTCSFCLSLIVEAKIFVR